MAPFYGWGSTAWRLQPLRGGSLLFTIQFPEIPGTHFIDLGRMKGWVDLGWRAESILWHPNFMKILRAYVLEKTRLPTDILAHRNTDTNIFSTLR